jgi:hypothetical protein
MGCFTVFISIFYLIGFGMFGYSLWNSRQSTRAAAWPTVPGTIADLALDEKSDSDGTTYEVKVRYTYTVDGVAYEGKRLAFGYSASSGREAHDEIFQKLSTAKAVDVRDDSADPAVSCLSFGLHRSIQIGLAFSLMWLAFVFGFTIVVWLFAQGDSILLKNLSVK